LRANGQPYKGINVLLWVRRSNGYACPIWMTKQAQQSGGQVRKGEHGALVVYADHMRRTGTDDNGDEVEREIPFSKAIRFSIASRSTACRSLSTHVPPLPSAQPVHASFKMSCAAGAR